MKRYMHYTACLSFVLAVGCGRETDSNTLGEPESALQVDASAILLTSVPADATNVIEARKTVKDKQDVVIVGRIGGREKPFVHERVAFSVVDLNLKCCDDIGADNCPKPWDYC